MLPTTKILVRKDLDELSRTAADLFAEIALRNINDKNSFSVALSGGSTPSKFFSVLASDEYRNRIPWESVRFFFSDERNVPPDASDSNYAMAYRTLLEPLEINTRQVFRWQTELDDVGRVAELYQTELEKNSTIDLVMLGLGADAHTASLFPNTDAVDERRFLAIANWVEPLADYRFTLTATAINAASNVFFLVSGKEKADAVANVLEGEFRPHDFPAQLIRPEKGQLFWLLDKAAASLLRNRENLQFRPAKT